MIFVAWKHFRFRYTAPYLSCFSQTFLLFFASKALQSVCQMQCEILLPVNGAYVGVSIFYEMIDVLNIFTESVFYRIFSSSMCIKSINIYHKFIRLEDLASDDNSVVLFSTSLNPKSANIQNNCTCCERKCGSSFRLFDSKQATKLG